VLFLSKECTVTEFGKLFHFKVVHEGQSVILNFKLHLREEKTGSFSLNRVLDVFRNLDSVSLRYGMLCMDGHITYVRDSILHSQFICTETQNPFFYYALKKLVGRRIPFNDWSEYQILQHEGSGFLQ